MNYVDTNVALRLMLGLLAVGVISSVGCKQSSGNIKTLVAQALNENRVDLIADKQVIAIGEEAIPYILEHIRRSSDKWWACYHGQTLIAEMVAKGTADPSAAYLRAVLDSNKEEDVIRGFVAESLQEYSSPEVRTAILTHALSDTALPVRIACIRTLQIIAQRPATEVGFEVDRDIQEAFSMLAKDTSGDIRLVACKAIAYFVEFGGASTRSWGIEELLHLQKDNDPRVRSQCEDILRKFDILRSGFCAEADVVAMRSNGRFNNLM